MRIDTYLCDNCNKPIPVDKETGEIENQIHYFQARLNKNPVLNKEGLAIGNKRKYHFCTSTCLRAYLTDLLDAHEKQPDPLKR